MAHDQAQRGRRGWRGAGGGRGLWAGRRLCNRQNAADCLRLRGTSSSRTSAAKPRSAKRGQSHFRRYETWDSPVRPPSGSSSASTRPWGQRHDSRRRNGPSIWRCRGRRGGYGRDVPSYAVVVECRPSSEMAVRCATFAEPRSGISLSAVCPACRLNYRLTSTGAEEYSREEERRRRKEELYSLERRFVESITPRNR